MKKRLSILLLMTISGFCFSQQDSTSIRFKYPSDPDLRIRDDVAFPFLGKATVLFNLGHDTGDPDGMVPTSNIEAITSLDLTNKNISDLTGIEDFIALEKLYCANNRLTSLDVSNNSKINHLNVLLNQLSSLDISHNASLKFLDCSYCQLTNLDVSNNLELTQLWCNNNELTSLDISNLESDEKAFEYFRIFPNAVSNMLSIEGEQGVKYEWTLLETSGKVLVKSSGCNQTTTMDLSSYKSGLYILSLVSDKSAFSYRIIKD